MTSQLQLLNYILSNKDYSIITMNNLTDKYFSEYKDEFNFIKNHYDLYHVVPDKLTFLDVFNDFNLVEVTEPTSYLINQLYRDYNRLLLAKNFNHMKPLLEGDKVEEAVDYILDSIEDLQSGSAMSVSNILTDTDERYNAYDERTRDFSKYYISTGFKELDAIIGGWDRQEEYGLIVARTNMGKSFVALKMAAAAAEQGLTVGIYSGEMTARKVGYRIDTLLGHISNGSLIHGNANIQNEYRKYLDNISTRVSGQIKVITPNDINGPADVPMLRSFIEKEHLDILFVDQISLLEDARRGKGPIEKTSNISRDIKNLQVMTRIPIIAVCQQNRSSTDDGVQNTTQIAQSDRLGQDATVVIFIDKKETNMKLSLVKSRDSENGKSLDYIVDFNKGYWTYVPGENDKDNAANMANRYETNNTNNTSDGIKWD